ncbi:4-hydroxyproline epimerase [Paraburkholderia caballeronis]|uniref:4-hydroxyproline epimerase n=1 Tax=Paraburkholderia caballeronis TaxID=416943 RepID=UPI001065FCDC|nr:4-hydroxyproline epimerase [Paraburkholderia caballeronis]TDV07809.1 4-hydroxyproline epimerase [Paraburkholderia caballeronis]TDV11172.1 4-hydroxyproline epimerase [Paraburkholderia caballeronis]TDV21552.1 4-hydroxyproline epimerase [Paraburkholderia caballeronis]
MNTSSHIDVIDSHTGGEPTRLVISGGPDLGRGPLAERLAIFRRDFDHVRAAVVNEPRGSDVMVGALLCEPHDPACSAGVIFFNNVGFLGMCGHGTIGLIVSLAHLGRIAPGVHRIETPVGVVEAELHDDGRVTVHNVPAYRYRTGVPVDVPGYGRVHGDIAWGGNWFFLVADHGQSLEFANVEALTDASWAIRRALEDNGITGEGGALIDHIELFAEPDSADFDSRNFVLCPGKAYDRSPCGTGTSAKIACLAADEVLAPGAVWRQASIIGSVFDASYAVEPGLPAGHVRPSIRGTAHVNAEARLIFSEADPFAWGIRQ